MTWKIILSIVLWVVVCSGQGLVVETLPALPSHSSNYIQFLVATSNGEIAIMATYPNFMGMRYDPQKKVWSVPQVQNGFPLIVPPPIEKTAEDGTILQTTLPTLGTMVYSSVGFPYKKVPAYAASNHTATRMSPERTFNPCIGTMNNLALDEFHGEFPSLDGKVYYTGLAMIGDVGIYSFKENPASLACALNEELILTDPEFQLIQVWREKSGTFLAERSPRNPQTTETEIVRISSNGDSTVLLSSSRPAKVTTAVCCDLAFDPDNWQGIASYKDKDGKYHVVVLTDGSPKEVYSATRWNLRPIALRGSYTLLAVNEYLGIEIPGKSDSFVLLDIETKESWTVYGPTTIPGIVKSAVNPFWASIDAIGSTYILVADPKDSTKDKVVKISLPPLPPLLVPKVETLGTVAPEALVVVMGVGLVAEKATTTILVDGIEVPTTVENGMVTFMAPIEPGEYTIVVRLKNISETIESEKMTLVVSADPLYRVGTISEIVSMYGEVESPAPNKIMILKGQDLCITGCIVRVGGIASTLQSVKTNESGSTITFVMPSDISLGKHNLIVEKVSTEGALINRSKPFSTEIVASAPTFLRLPDDATYFLVANEKGLVTGDNPVNAGDTLVGWVTGRGTEKFVLTIDDREVKYEIISDERPGLERIKFVMPETIWYGSNIKFAPPERVFWFNTNPPPSPKTVE